MNGTTGQNSTDARVAASQRLASLRRFLDAEPGNSRLRRDVVDTAVAAGEFGLVRELAERRLVDAPSDPEAQFDRATALIGLKDFAGALAAMQPLDATIPGVRFNTGLCLFALERFADARPCFDAGYAAGERSAGQLRCYLRTLHHLGEIEAALAIAKENPALVASDGELAGVCSLLAIDVGDVATGKRYAQMALAANPDNLDALVSAGSLHAVDLDMARARAAFDHALQIQPRAGRAWIGLGMMSMGEGNLVAARQQLERGLELMPEHVGSWLALGWAHIFSGDLDAAERVVNRALELNHNFCESHGCLAVVAAMRGDRARAGRLIEVAERLDPACMSSKYAMSLLAGSPEQGRAMLTELVSAVPGHGPKIAAMLRQAAARSKS